MLSNEPILKIRNLNKDFKGENGQIIKGVSNINLDLYKGEALGIIGETGSGKSTLGKIILNIEKPSSGEIYYNNKNITNLKSKELRELYLNIQIIFQNPHSTFNPRMKIGKALQEPLINYNIMNKKESQKEVINLLNMVELCPKYINKYPHELSGGELQRVAIARAIAVKPKILICDEITSSIDVSIQHEIGKLLVKLQNKIGISYIFIGHNIAFVKKITHRIGIMYKSELLEVVNSNNLLSESKNPYTKKLLNSVLYV